MCGICGIARRRSGAPIDPAVLGRMNDVIAHRGPNDSGIHRASDGRVGLGNRRLSIIDLSPAGHMPMANEDESVWITYNGEIFNFPELRLELESKGYRFKSNTDTEVLLHLFEDRGVEAFAALNGMFGVAIWDERRRTLTLARDPFGIKPLYYASGADGQLAFASEIKSLIAGGMVVPEVDAEALHYYLNFLWVPGPKTMFRGVFKLPPGHCLVWKDGQHEIRPYWNGRPSVEETDRGEQSLLEELRERLTAAVRRHLISDVPLGVFLSGGLDSSAILALATRISNRSMKAYTIAYRAEDSRAEQSNEDAKYARVMARACGADHHEIEISPDIVDLLPKVVWHMDEPVADPAAITSYMICQAAREQVTVLLSGQGGDEIFGGYRVHLADRLSRPLSLWPQFVRDKLLLPAWNMVPAVKDHLPGVTPGKVMAFHRYFNKLLRGAGYPQAERYVFHRSYFAPGEQRRLYSERFGSTVESFDPYATHLKYFDQTPNASFTDRMLYVDQNTFLPELNLTYSDRTSMAASVEVRVPLLDQSVAAFMRQIPGKWKVKGLTQKYLFKRAMEGVLPESVIWRGKAAFGAPIRTWLRKDLREMVHDFLSPASVAARGYFKTDAVQQMVAAHEAETEDNTYRIWALLTLEMWHRTYIDTEPVQ
jgi:asparagine synthase (glutamine-hydrolysing)